MCSAGSTPATPTPTIESHRKPKPGGPGRTCYRRVVWRSTRLRWTTVYNALVELRVLIRLVAEFDSPVDHYVNIAQMVEHLLDAQEIASSSLAVHTEVLPSASVPCFICHRNCPRRGARALQSQDGGTRRWVTVFPTATNSTAGLTPSHLRRWRNGSRAGLRNQCPSDVRVRFPLCALCRCGVTVATQRSERCVP